MRKNNNIIKLGKVDVALFAHHAFVLFLPIAVFALVRFNFLAIAITLILVSKWRILSVKPRFWLINLRANAVGLLVGISIALFMDHDLSLDWQLSWLVIYIIWILVIRTGASLIMNAVQSMVALALALTAFFMVASSSSLWILVLGVGAICYVTAHHFLDDFDEPFTKFLSYLWAFMGSSITWVLGHWLLFYGLVAQPALVLLVLGYGLGGLYLFNHRDKLSRVIKLEFTFIIIIVMVVNLVALAVSSSQSSLI